MVEADALRPGPESFRVADIIDRSPIGAFQVRVFLLCGLLVFIEGAEIQAIGYVAAALSKAWQLAPAQMGLFVSVGLVGVMLGALLVAPLADRVGRRPLLLASVAFFGVCSLGTAFTTTIPQLFVMRLLTGVGLGGALPNAIALCSEYSPRQRQAAVVMTLMNALALGSICGGLLAAWLVQAYSWKAVFVCGGILPLAVCPLLYRTLPESIRFLLHAGPAGRQKAAALLVRLSPAQAPIYATQLVLDETGMHRMSVRELFRQQRARTTLLIWLIFFMSLLNLYLLVSWLPKMMVDRGASTTTAAWIGVALQVGGIVGALSLSVVANRRGARMALVLGYFTAAGFIASLGLTLAERSLTTTILLVLGAGFGVIGGQAAANAAAARTYPTSVRATGVGWALGIGRIGSIVGPTAGGWLLGRNTSASYIFTLCAVPALIAAIAALTLPKSDTADDA